MSSAQKSQKSASKSSLEDIDSMITPKNIKKEALKAATTSKPKTTTTRAKSAASKRKRSSEPETHFDMILAAVNACKYHYEKIMNRMSEKMTGMGSVVVTKDKTLIQLLQDKKEVGDSTTLRRSPTPRRGETGYRRGKYAGCENSIAG